MKVIVFGGSGFIGSHVCEQLLLAGHTVTAVVRKITDQSFLQSIGADIKEIDFNLDEMIVDAIKGHEAVYNCLANVKLHQSIESHRAVEVLLTERIIKSASTAKAKRFVQLSTVQVYGFSRPKTAIDEQHNCQATYLFNQVAQEREVAVKKVADATGIELVIARPVNTIGNRNSTMIEIFKLHKKGLMVIFGNGENKFSCIDTRDLGRAMVLLGECSPAAGNTYLISGYDTTWKEINKTLGTIKSRESRLICVPSMLGKTIAWLLEKIIPYSYDLQLTPFSVSVMCTQTLFDDERIRELGFTPEYDIIETLKGCIK
jgi:dihydroflavonol-4-reductase